VLSLLAGSLTSCISIKGTPMVLDNRDNEDATRHDEGHGKDDNERGGWAVVPILQQWVRFFSIDSSYLTSSTTESPTVAPDATKTMKTPSPRYIALSTRFSACQTRRNVRGTCHHQHNPPKTSVRARFRRLWVFPGRYHHDNPSAAPHNCRNRARTLDFGGCGLSLPATTTNHQSTAEIKRPRLFPALVGFLCLSNVPQISTTPPNRARLDFSVQWGIFRCCKCSSP